LRQKRDGKVTRPVEHKNNSTPGKHAGKAKRATKIECNQNEYQNPGHSGLKRRNKDNKGGKKKASPTGGSGQEKGGGKVK